MTPTALPSRLHLAAVFGLTLLLAGCGVIRKGEAPPPSPHAARAMLEEHFKNIHRFEGVFFLNVESPQYNLALKGTCRLEHPDRLQGRLLGPFGIRLGEFVFNGGAFQVRMANGRVMDGDVGDLDVPGLTGLELPTDDVLSLFDPTAKPPRTGARTLAFKVEKETGFWLWRVDDGTLVREIQLDPVKRVVRFERWMTKDDTVLLNKEYDQFEQTSGMLVAHRLVLESRTVQPVKAELVYESLRLDPDWKDDPFSLMEPVSR
ncbi:MAG: hypothetical protein V2A56_00770 [bacterium]